VQFWSHRPAARGLVLAIVIAPLILNLQAQPVHAGYQGCTISDRQHALATDQWRVLQRVGDLTTLRGPADLTRLATIGYSIYPHQFVSFKGMGMPVLDPSTLVHWPGHPLPEVGHPSLLLYRPAPWAQDVTDLERAEFPYTLAGWAYGDNYHWAQIPSLPCLVRGDWFVHERGIHPLIDGGFIPVPPPETFHGQADGSDAPYPVPFDQPWRVGVPHPRAWDTHIWLSGGGPVPKVSMLNPGKLIPGLDPQVGVAFFYSPTSA
jgi:hypothetical protein